MATLQLEHVDVTAGDVISRPGPTVAYSVAAAAATFGADGSIVAEHDGLHLVWSLVQEPAADAVRAADVAVDGEPQLLRCDRVAFPPGGVAFLHTHQGPGIRCLVEGRFAVETQGVRHDIERLGAWFEAGPEPVYAEVRGDAPAAFVRVMLLPRHLLGAPSIRYVREEDRDRPKSQRYTVYIDEPLA
jgi:hypothetical protein